jgi:hypothetical protein
MLLFSGLIFATLLHSAFLRPPTHDQYGGWSHVKGKKTGFFHTQQINGRWWLVTPEGNAFFSKGVCHVDYRGDHSPPLGYSPYNQTVAARYGSAGKWATATAKRMKGWGLNTVGAWSSPDLYKQKIAYAPVLDLAASTAPDLWLRGGFPDVFSPQFREAVEKTAARLCKPYRNDPWLLGYFTDNELRWGPDWRSRESLLETFLRVPENSPGRKRAEQFLDDVGDPDGTLSEKEKADFQQLAAGEYFRICHEAIRKADPNHLILGCRFAGYAPEPVLRGAKDWVDIVSYNDYSHAPPVDQLKRLTQITGRPVMLTEFSFRAMDSGLPNTKGAGKPVQTQQERADLFERYVTALARLPNCLGYHWFEYADEPKEGRFDGENSNYGLVRIDDTPWEALTEHLRTVNATLETAHATPTPAR